MNHNYYDQIFYLKYFLKILLCFLLQLLHVQLFNNQVFTTKRSSSCKKKRAKVQKRHKTKYIFYIWSSLLYHVFM